MASERGARLERWLTPRRAGVLAPLAVFLLFSGLVLAFSVSQKKAHIRQVDVRTETVADQLVDRLPEVVEQRLDLARALREQWQQPDHSLENLQDVALLLQQQSPGLLAINWIDRDGLIQWVAPYADNEDALGKNVGDNPQAGPFFRQAREERTDRISAPLKLYQGGWGFVAYLPTIREGELAGFINAVFRFGNLFDYAVPEEVRTQYGLQVFYDGELIYDSWREGAQRTAERAVERDLASQGNEFVLRLLPHEDTVRMEPTKIWSPLIFGLLLALILALLIRALVVSGTRLRQQQQLMDRIFSELPVSALRIAEDGTIEQSIGAGAERLGFIDEHHESGTLDSVPVIARYLSRALEGESVEFELDGRWRGEPWTYQFFFFPDEIRGQGIVAFAMDISDRKRAEEALRRSEEQYRRFFQEAPFAYFVVDPEGKIELANPRAMELSGYTLGELAGRSVLDLYAPGSQGRTRAAELFDRMLLGEEIRNLEVKLQRADRSVLWGSLSIQAIRNAHAQLTGCRYLLVDITQRKELEERFRQSQKMEAVGRLAGGIAHDFNNLLTAIMGYARLAVSRADLDQAIRSDLSEIQKAGQRAASLVSQLLTFSRRQITESKVFDLNHLVREMDPMLRRLVREEVEIFSKLSVGLPNVRMDPGQMEQVVMNLVVNGQEAIERTGIVTLETDVFEPSASDRERAQGDVLRADRYVRLQVSDNGSGMSEEVMDHVFEPFFTTKRDGAGTGLGLATVYGIVEQAGGAILVDSEPGEGTTLSILLPCVEEELTRESVPAPGELPRGAETVLLVEDEDTVRNLAQEMLQSLGYAVITAEDGVAALETIQGREEQIDLLLTDVVMPRMGGERLYDEMARLRPGLPVLYSSGYTESTVIHHGVRDGGVPFMHKPYTLDEMAHAVRKVLDSRGS
ncbi:MAG: PAS domain S-box protein [Thermoanaerobaculia bacterium]|nr:PAS domain S-box protein [Thermoanaerobaculia bacterium]